MGFDNECILNIQNLAGEYFCPVCRMLVYPNEALQSQCTHLYCKHCLTYIVATTRACPYDGYLVTLEDSKPLLESNKALAETIGKIAVHCLYHRSGCTWQGPLSDCSSHCSACAFGNSPVVCNRCAIQIMHRQVQEHAQSCPGALTAEGTVSSTAFKDTHQMQATVQGATVSSHSHASHVSAAAPPGQVSSQSASPNPNPPLFTQAALPVTNLSHQQQYYQQYPGYDPYQQHYQQCYQQHYPQQFIPHPPLQPQPQVQSLPPRATQSQVQTIPQQQPPSLAHPQPPAQILPPAQHYSQWQAIDIGHQQQPHTMIRPQSQLRPNPQSRPQTQPQPHIHLQAHLPVQLQQNSEVRPQTWPPQANYVNHYPSISHMSGDHLYPIHSQSGLAQQSSSHSYPQGGPQQQQHPAQVRNQVSQQLTNPMWMQAVNHQKPLVIPSPSHQQIVPNIQQQNTALEQTMRVLHHHSPMQAVRQPLAPQYLQQVHQATHAPMHPQLRFNVPPLMPNETTQPLQNVPFPHNERLYQSQSQDVKVSVQLQPYPVSTESMDKTELALSGSHHQSETWIRSDNQPHSAAEQQGGYFQPLVGSQSEPKLMSAEDCVARVRMEGQETPLVENKPSELLLRMGASGNGVPSCEKGVKKESVNDSVKHISVGKSGSATGDLKERDPDEVKSKLMDSQNIQPGTKMDEISPDVATTLAPLSVSVEGLPSDVRPTSASLNTPFCGGTFVSSEAENSFVPHFVAHSASSNHLAPFVSDGGRSYPAVLNSDIPMMVNPPSYVYERCASMPTGPVAHSWSSFDGIQPYLRHSGSSSETNFTPAGLKAGPDMSLTSGLRDERFRGPRDTMPLEQGSQRILQEDRLQFPRPPDMESELFCKQDRFFSSMPYKGDYLGFSKIPSPLDKAFYGLHHDEHLQHDAFPKDNRLNLRHDVWGAASMHGRRFGVHYGSPDREHPNTSLHTIRYGTCIDFRLGTDDGDHNLLAPKKPLNMSSDLAELSVITSNLPPHLHKGSLGSFSGQARNAELLGNGSIRPLIGEMGSRSNFLLAENPFHKVDLELYDNLRKRKAATMGWCRICKVDCDTVEGLDLHSQTREHQRMSMDMVMEIKQQNSKRQKLPSKGCDTLPKKLSSQDY